MNILQTLTGVLKSSLAGAPPPPSILAGLDDRLDKLFEVSVDPTGDGIDRWLHELNALLTDDRLRDTLLVRALQMHVPRIAEALTMLGVVVIEWDGSSPAAFRLDTAKLDDLLARPGQAALELLGLKVQKLADLQALQVLVLLLISAPQALLELEYQQQGFAGLPLGGVPGVSSDELIRLIAELVHSPVRLPLPIREPLSLSQVEELSVPAAEGDLGFLAMDGPAAFTGLTGLALELQLRQAGQLASKKVPLGGDWALTFQVAAGGDVHVRLELGADGVATGSLRGELGVFVGKRPATGDALLIGDRDGTHLSVGAVELGVRLRSSGPVFDLVLRLTPIEFALKPDFLRFLSFGLDLPTQLRFRSGVDIAYTQGQGLTGQAAGGGPPGLSLQFATPVDLKVGGAGAGVAVDQVVTGVDLALDGGQLRFRVTFRYSATARFGPLGAQMNGAGVWLGRWSDGFGGLLPPTGIGVSLAAGPVDGGGFLQVTGADEFAGSLQLKILGIGAFAFGLYQALPSGDVSVIALIGIRLPVPGVQLGFGFAISGFGGLVGINRRADTDRLRERLASGAAGDVLFTDDPVRNAPKLLGDLQQFFPAEQGVFLVGPTLQINWLYILRLDVAVVIELPGPRKVFFAGSARLVLGSEEFALVYLRMDFIGGVDLTKSLIFFDAALVNSTVLGIFRITGGVALRIAYGSNGYFLFTVGGFHPSFDPGAMELPRVARVGVSVSLGPVWLKQEMYLAITSNTFQLGSRVEAGLEIGPISGHGWFAFDALIQFSPFWFVATIDAGFDVEVEGVSLCSVRVDGRLSGPGPLVLHAHASVRLLFIKVSGSVTIQLSSNPPEAVSAIPDLPAHFRGELSLKDNLRMDGTDASVVAAPLSVGTGPPLFSPVGQLVWEQKRVPLGLAIQKAEGTELDGWHTLQVTSGLVDAGAETDWFGVGTYLHLSDAEALNTSRFVQQTSGLRVGSGIPARGAQVPKGIALTLVKLPRRSVFTLVPGALYLGTALSGLLGERRAGPVLRAGAAQVAVVQETWKVPGSGTAPLNAAQAFALAAQTGGIAVPATQTALDLSGVL